MGTSDSYLPSSLSTEAITTSITSLNLPTPISIEPLQVRAAFHNIYLIHFPSSSDIPARSNPDGTITLVFRVSGQQLPGIKTRNEVGIMTWVRQNTTIPVPAVIHFDDTDDNPIKHEFTLLEKAPGVSVDQIYDTLSDEDKTQLEGYVGGLTLDGDGNITHGPPIDENYWQMPDLGKYWSDPEIKTKETLESLNPIAPDGYPSYVDYTVCCLERYIHAITIHPTLKAYRDMIPSIRAFITNLQREENTADLNATTYILAHKDLHFANIMCDPSQSGCPITAVLDWEFSGVVPAPRWNPPRAFLWNVKWTDGDKAEQSRMEGLFENIVRERGAVWILQQMELNGKQEQMQTAVNHIRAIVEVCPRGQAGEKVRHWRETAERAMDAFT
ncbi:hypothetical protein BDW74DRAFT_187057 [Aspergillus multicolor]|uniref:phosphotransferase family protein n=1 Tax=Aspergillus multicolor TaxID=41759 RepID=UPI003CCC9771